MSINNIKLELEKFFLKSKKEELNKQIIDLHLSIFDMQWIINTMKEPLNVSGKINKLRYEEDNGHLYLEIIDEQEKTQKYYLHIRSIKITPDSIDED